ncbi:GIY-YIG nuclease family protein [Pararhodonellum marinum]|uniref:GIY-YIG nuclease family protein n=1 Tax=Pararhodonellum marinum TaxID=2755358 RepID=UPI00188ECDC5|nr:GIY-YIG nuclease family protein [Pararhodonellum marinum]
MVTVYVLYSFSSDKLYIGVSEHFIRRFHFHNQFATKGFTIRYRPWFCIHNEFFADKKQALIREKQLKSGQGRQWIRETILPLYR